VCAEEMLGFSRAPVRSGSPPFPGRFASHAGGARPFGDDQNPPRLTGLFGSAIRMREPASYVESAAYERSPLAFVQALARSGGRGRLHGAAAAIGDRWLSDNRAVITTGGGVAHRPNPATPRSPCMVGARAGWPKGSKQQARAINSSPISRRVPGQHPRAEPQQPQARAGRKR